MTEPAPAGLTDAPGPRYRVPGASILAFRRDPLTLLRTLAREHGDVARIQLGTSRVFLLNHPDLIRDVLVTHNRRFMKGVGLQRAKRLLGEGLLTSEGSVHLRQRRLAQPAFHHERVAAYADVMTECAAATSARWEAAEPNTVLDVHTEMMRLALSIVGRTLFGSDVEGAAEEVSAAVGTSLELFQSFSTMPFAALIERLPLPSTRRFARARERLDRIVYGLIAERRADGRDRGDLLSMLLRAEDADTGGARMSDTQLRDEVMTIFLAGHETTANALTWTWYLLSTHPEVERRWHRELDALGSQRPGADDLERLPLTGMIVRESMRLFPPAWVIGRRALSDHAAGRFRVPADSIVLLSQFVTHRDSRWFPEPERFDPERWTAEGRASRPRFSYFPFGGGARVCIGEQFAMMEAVLVLAVLGRRWRLAHDPTHQVALAPSITLRPRFGMRMRAERRPSTPAV